jgi:APA family basic amino acid/polyamine antiporter
MRIQITAGVLIAIVAAFTQVEELDEMINIGTLSAFILVSFAIPILRKQQSKRGNSNGTVINNKGKNVGGFRVPLSPFLPIFSGVFCCWLALNLSNETWIRFVAWLLIGFVVYFGYGRKHSELAKNPQYIAE